jgi:hypothetical protein
MSGDAEYASSVASLRDELGALSLQGGISNQFADWHGRLSACAQAITKEVPSCADLCAELISIDFEIPPEFAANMAKELSDDHRIISAGSEAFFRSRCDEADEILHTLLIALRQATRK